jgi:hypothetical protein
MKRELILESPYLLLHSEIKIFIPDIHRTSYGHLNMGILLHMGIVLYVPWKLPIGPPFMLSLSQNYLFLNFDI